MLKQNDQENGKIELPQPNENNTEASVLEKTRDLLDLFICCHEVSDFINKMEAEMFSLKILSERKPEPFIKLELLLYELASDPHLTDGVFYAISISFTPEGQEKSKILVK